MLKRKYIKPETDVLVMEPGMALCRNSLENGTNNLYDGSTGRNSSTLAPPTGEDEVVDDPDNPVGAKVNPNPWGSWE